MMAKCPTQEELTKQIAEIEATIAAMREDEDDAPTAGTLASAVVTEIDTEDIPPTDIVFDCPACGHSHAVAPAGAGIRIACVGCGKPLAVPETGKTDAGARGVPHVAPASRAIPVNRPVPQVRSAGPKEPFVSGRTHVRDGQTGDSGGGDDGGGGGIPPVFSPRPSGTKGKSGSTSAEILHGLLLTDEVIAWNYTETQGFAESAHCGAVIFLEDVASVEQRFSHKPWLIWMAILSAAGLVWYGFKFADNTQGDLDFGLVCGLLLFIGFLIAYIASRVHTLRICSKGGGAIECRIDGAGPSNVAVRRILAAKSARAARLHHL